MYSFLKDILGFLMSTESLDLGLTSHLKDGNTMVVPDLQKSTEKNRTTVLPFLF